MLLLFCFFNFGDNYYSSSGDIFISIIALIVSILSLYTAARWQAVSLSLQQLSELSRVCNSYLQDDYQVHKKQNPLDEWGTIDQGRASGIVTALEDAEILIKKHSGWRKQLLLGNEQKFRRFFIASLHSSIKVLLKKEDKFHFRIPAGNDDLINGQLERAIKYFNDEIAKYRKFEKEREAEIRR